MWFLVAFGTHTHVQIHPLKAVECRAKCIFQVYYPACFWLGNLNWVFEKLVHNQKQLHLHTAKKWVTSALHLLLVSAITRYCLLPSWASHKSLSTWGTPVNLPADSTGHCHLLLGMTISLMFHCILHLFSMLVGLNPFCVLHQLKTDFSSLQVYIYIYFQLCCRQFTSTIPSCTFFSFISSILFIFKAMKFLGFSCTIAHLYPFFSSSSDGFLHYFLSFIL